MSRPVIGVSCSTLVLPGMRGVPRFAIVHGYVDAILTAGGLPMMFPNVEPETVEGYLDHVDGVVLSGGLDVDPVHYDEEPHPKLGQVDVGRDAFELVLARAVLARQMPLLAICRGVQVLNVAMGGSLIQDIPSQVEASLRHDQDTLQQDALAHSVDVAANTWLGRLCGARRVRVNSYHHQALGRVAEGFVVSGRSPDGVIEAVEHPGLPFCIGVQWHPERTPSDPLTRGLFGGLVASAAESRGARVAAASSGR